jgi:hypothetical protein
VFELTLSQLLPNFCSKGVVMMDLIFIAVTLAFFLISIAYVYACDRLR